MKLDALDHDVSIGGDRRECWADVNGENLSTAAGFFSWFSISSPNSSVRAGFRF
ncbi:MAG: hypothetical protein ACRELF_26625 [Gemmataceae bacterium]